VLGVGKDTVRRDSGAFAPKPESITHDSGAFALEDNDDVPDIPGEHIDPDTGEIFDVDGLSQRQIADVLGVGVATVNRDLGESNDSTPANPRHRGESNDSEDNDDAPDILGESADPLGVVSG